MLLAYRATDLPEKAKDRLRRRGSRYSNCISFLPSFLPSPCRHRDGLCGREPGDRAGGCARPLSLQARPRAQHDLRRAEPLGVRPLTRQEVRLPRTRLLQGAATTPLPALRTLRTEIAISLIREPSHNDTTTFTQGQGKQESNKDTLIFYLALS